jgi:hypothetical protein
MSSRTSGKRRICDYDRSRTSIGALYGIEEQVRGKPSSFAARSARTAPSHYSMSLRQWKEKTLRSLSAKRETAGAIRYALLRWRALTRYVDNGLLEIDNSAAERALRAVAIGRKNYLFMGADSRPTSCCALQPHRNCQVEQNRSGLLPANSPRKNFRPSNQSHRKTPALEHRRLNPNRFFPGRLDPLIRCPLRNKRTPNDTSIDVD